MLPAPLNHREFGCQVADSGLVAILAPLVVCVVELLFAIR